MKPINFEDIEVGMRVCRGEWESSRKPEFYEVARKDTGEISLLYAGNEVKYTRSVGWYVMDETASTKNNGGSTDYYKLPAGATELNDLIEAKNMPFWRGNIFKAAYRLGEKDVATEEYDLNKIIYFANRRLAMIRKEKGNG